MNNGDARNIITIGASAGGIEAVSRLLATFNENLDAAVFIVIHVSKNSLTEVILNTLQKYSRLKCLIPTDNQPIENRKVYLAPADHHMMIEKDKIIIKKGAYENHWRPSIDVLFRSAAVAYASCVTGIILTGLLDDGTSGMYAIKRSGGLSMVQNPAEADFPDMPENVINAMDVDYKVVIDEMGYILSDLFSRAECNCAEVPADVKLEADIAKRMSSQVENLNHLAVPGTFTCPGHIFTQKIFEDEQIKGIEDSLWVAIRMMEERKNLLISISARQTDPSRLERVNQIELHVNRLKGMLMDLGRNS